MRAPAHEHRDLHPLVCRCLDAVAGKMRGNGLGDCAATHLRVDAAARSEEKENDGKRDDKNEVQLPHVAVLP